MRGDRRTRADDHEGPPRRLYGRRLRARPGLAPTAEEIALAAQAACVLEVSAPKPGNVNRYADFANTRLEDFLLSAVAIGPALARAGRAGVGQIIWQAVRDSQRLVCTNTNLGILLLLAPLAKACLGAGELRENLAQVLAGLTVEDARQAYAAIRLARPGGLGRAPQADVAEEPTITLYQAMSLAQERDSIAREYVTNFAITFEIGYPALREAWHAADSPADAIVQTYLTLLARVPDTLIARKRGAEVAGQVSRWAAEVLGAGGVFTAQGRQALVDLDRDLRNERHTLNPGTTADLTAAAIFLVLLYDSCKDR
ncbi:MAG: triphosphoribosyl-dephospho-CoA synthase [Chloroflexota bacterium]